MITNSKDPLTSTDKAEKASKFLTESIDLLSEVCVKMGQTEVALERAEKESENLRVLLRDICKEWNEGCSEECDKLMHHETCQRVNIAQAKRAMQQRIDYLEDRVKIIGILRQLIMEIGVVEGRNIKDDTKYLIQTAITISEVDPSSQPPIHKKPLLVKNLKSFFGRIRDYFMV